MIEAHHPAPGSPGSASFVIPYRGSNGLLVDRLGAAQDLGARDLVVDLGDAETLSSATLEILLRTGRELRGRGGRLEVVSLRPSLRRLLRLTLLHRAFAVHTSLETALRQPA
ncbi:MAG TPA: STAS domain-containing protein [Gaiellaceae bacterium]|nr:STAS domain-containing protein [Gaiellaceae bacterium]